MSGGRTTAHSRQSRHVRNSYFSLLTHLIAAITATTRALRLNVKLHVVALVVAVFVALLADDARVITDLLTCSCEGVRQRETGEEHHDGGCELWTTYRTCPAVVEHITKGELVLWDRIHGSVV